MQKAVDLLERSLSRAASLDDALAELRLHALTPAEVIKAIREVKKVDLGEAKRLFSRAPAWSVENEMADRLHSELLGALSNEPES